MSKVIRKKYHNRVEYTLNKKYHREGGPAVEYFGKGDKWWYLHGELHREDGPAIENADYKHWFLHGKRHRENGPAIEYANGHKEYWVDGKRLDFITSDQMLTYYLKYGFLK